MKKFLVVTSISNPTVAMELLATKAKINGYSFLCIGDKKSPPDFNLPGCRFLSLEDQFRLPYDFVKRCPVGRYSRKNIGYLLAAMEGADVIVETDDDNEPYDTFFDPGSQEVQGRLIEGDEWINVYEYFTDHGVWPRGYPLEEINEKVSSRVISYGEAICPVQQRLADGDPDVDAVFRMTQSLPLHFRQDVPVVLGKGCWCPFNSQNTVWWRQAFPLLYLPSYCSFRMTDIWRSFVCQACLWPNDWSVGFLSSTVVQNRNEHNLLDDFKDEVPGYLNNGKIARALNSLVLESCSERLFDNMKRCYSVLIEMGVVGKEEMVLLDAWRSDLERILML